MLDENELVAPEVACLRCQADQVVSAFVPVDHFEKLAAEATDNVLPQRHSPNRPVIPKGL
jgi:hypothetical protein